MVHQNIQEAIAQLSMNDMGSEEIRNQFDLNEEDMKAIKSQDTLIQGVTQPAPALTCCSCCG